MLLANYIRGTNDAMRYSHVDQTGTGWIARQSDTAAPVWIIEPVDQDYLQGLYDGGCKVRARGDVPGSTAMDRLRNRVTELMGAA